MNAIFVPGCNGPTEAQVVTVHFKNPSAGDTLCLKFLVPASAALDAFTLKP